MRELTEKGTKDAAAVKVLTIITLIYLPATVVSVSDVQFCVAFPVHAEEMPEFFLNAIC